MQTGNRMMLLINGTARVLMTLALPCLPLCRTCFQGGQNPALAKLLCGLAGLPCGLLMTAVTGSELFTGNTALVGTAYLERKVRPAVHANVAGCMC